MKINVTNEQEIAAALDEVQKRSRIRTVTARDILEASEFLEGHLDRFATKAARIGTTAHIDLNAQNFPGNYGGMPESTQFKLERTSTGWFVTYVNRLECRRDGHRFSLVLPELAQKQAVAHASNPK
jgi:hypothetical protein